MIGERKPRAVGLRCQDGSKTSTLRTRRYRRRGCGDGWGKHRARTRRWPSTRGFFRGVTGSTRARTTSPWEQTSRFLEKFLSRRRNSPMRCLRSIGAGTCPGSRLSRGLPIDSGNADHRYFGSVVGAIQVCTQPVFHPQDMCGRCGAGCVGITCGQGLVDTFVVLSEFGGQTGLAVTGPHAGVEGP